MKSFTNATQVPASRSPFDADVATLLAAHDAATQSLFGMTLIAQALPRLLEREPERAMERIGRLHELGRGALAELRALSFHLRPAALTEPLAGS